MSDAEVQYRALRDGLGALRVACDVLAVDGPDAARFLQTQLSADVVALGPGASTQSLLLDPSGKLVAWLRVWATDSPERYLVEVDDGVGRVTLDRLNRFRLREKVEIESMRWQRVMLRGPGSRSDSGVPPDSGSRSDSRVPPDSVSRSDLRGGPDSGGAKVGAATAPQRQGLLRAPVDWPGVAGLDLVGEGVEIPTGAVQVDQQVFDAVRIECGWPAMGAEFPIGGEPSVIPAEAGSWLVDASVSFTKGCYTGQELVARVDSRGSNTPRRLRGLVIRGSQQGVGTPPSGAVISVGGESRGVLTSVGFSQVLGAWVALAFVHRSVVPGEEVHLTWGEGTADSSCSAVIHQLPLEV